MNEAEEFIRNDMWSGFQALQMRQWLVTEEICPCSDSGKPMPCSLVFLYLYDYEPSVSHLGV